MSAGDQYSGGECRAEGGRAGGIGGRCTLRRNLPSPSPISRHSPLSLPFLFVTWPPAPKLLFPRCSFSLFFFHFHASFQSFPLPPPPPPPPRPPLGPRVRRVVIHSVAKMGSWGFHSRPKLEVENLPSSDCDRQFRIRVRPDLLRCDFFFCVKCVPRESPT